MAIIVALSMLGLIPAVLLMSCPQSICDPRACMDNLQGLAQRCMVAGMVMFIATYGLDIWTMQRSLAFYPTRELGDIEVQQQD